MTTPDWTAVRARFPGVRGQVYLDTASYGLPSMAVAEAVREAVDAWAAGRGDWRAWEDSGELSRRGFARLIGAAPETVALVPTFSIAAGQVAERIPCAPGANLVVGGGEFRSNLFPWLVQERRGFELREVAFQNGRFDPLQLASAVDDSTALVAASHVQSSSGYRLDLAPVIEACRRHDARLFVDGTQSIGALRLPLDGIDYLGVAGYKWLSCPRGASFLYVAPEHIGEMEPVYGNWKSPDDPYAEYYGGPLELSPRASRFDTSLAWVPWMGAAPALEHLLELGIAAIEERVLALAARFRDGLPALGLESLFAPAESSSIVALRVPDPDAVREGLRARNIRAAVRGPYLRVALHYYNDEEDVDRALEALGEISRP